MVMLFGTSDAQALKSGVDSDWLLMFFIIHHLDFFFYCYSCGVDISYQIRIINNWINVKMSFLGELFL